jgi:hypothetical protein
MQHPEVRIARYIEALSEIGSDALACENDRVQMPSIRSRHRQTHSWTRRRNPDHWPSLISRRGKT